MDLRTSRSMLVESTQRRTYLNEHVESVNKAVKEHPKAHGNHDRVHVVKRLNMDE